MSSKTKSSENPHNDNGTSHRKNVYFSKDALNEEYYIAKKFDEHGYAGMFNSNGKVNRSNVVNACYLVFADKPDLIAKKHAQN